eukprot:5564600-Amphidinium_carterae.1
MDPAGPQKKRKGADDAEADEQPAPKKWVPDQRQLATQIEHTQEPAVPQDTPMQEAQDPMQKL